ncbi:hypothetical protein K435DRAFT_861428 [Dendrothele bispora CBS 962.96]|uniref:Uncharacterized protein n=1 Tax=Dendrothele bispora (strain CBS 962.96) TaxID=1314807 RepID=A0A4S8LV68_DENBC|nr:hypothetical protein K435DRAFT_861428 [Dendrothele bispora CBS 962.96]
MPPVDFYSHPHLCIRYSYPPLLLPTMPKKASYTDTEAEQAFPEVPLPDPHSEGYPKRTARRKVFPEDQDAWIQMQTAQFHTILEDVNRSTSDKEQDEAMFKRAKVIQFERKFPSSERPDGYIKKINQIFANLKSRSKTGSSGTVDDSPPFPSYMLLSGKLGSGAGSGYSLFAAKNRETINDEVNEYRRKNQIDQRQHPSLLRSFSSRAWVQLSADEQARYAAEASAIKREQGAPEDIYHNQTETLAMIQCILHRSIGHGPGQIGNASYFVFLGYRDQEDRLENLILQAGPSFEEFLGKGESEVLESRWAQFAERSILPNRPVLHDREFKRSEAGHYLLEASEAFSTSNAGGHEGYLAYLRRFLDATWANDFSRTSKVPNAPWELITQAPGDYLHHALYDGKPLTNLETSHARLYSFADSIVQFQSANSTTSIFLPSAAATASTNVGSPASLAAAVTPPCSGTNVTSSFTPPLPSPSPQPTSPSPTPSNITASKEPDPSTKNAFMPEELPVGLESLDDVLPFIPPLKLPTAVVTGVVEDTTSSVPSSVGTDSSLPSATPAQPLSSSTSISTIVSPEASDGTVLGIPPLISSTSAAPGRVEDLTQREADPANPNKDTSGLIPKPSTSAQPGVEVTVDPTHMSLGPLKRKRGAEDNTVSNANIPENTVNQQTKKSSKGRKGNTKRVQNIVEVQDVEEDTGSRRTSKRQRKVKDPNADNKYTGSPEHKKKKKN